VSQRCQKNLLSAVLQIRIRIQPKISMWIPELGTRAFFALLRFRAREREAIKKAREREENKARKKAKAPSAEEKKREFALFFVFGGRRLDVSMYVLLYVCMYLRMYACGDVNMWGCMYSMFSIWGCMYVCGDVCTVCMWGCMYECGGVCMCVCRVYVHMCVCV
jgi:hypothetical protein